MDNTISDKLRTLYDNVIWVSKNSSKIYKTHPGYNPEGQDGLGYDIEYLDFEWNKYYIEVKGKMDNFGSFDISKNEIDKAHEEQYYYKIYFVTDTLDNNKRKIKDLGNLFLLENGEDFFINKRFTPVYKNFEIRFQTKAD